MKLLISVISIALALSACNSNTKTNVETKKEIVADTTTNYNNSILTDTATAIQPQMELSTVVKPAAPEVKKNKISPKSEKPVTTTTAKVMTKPVPASPENTTVNTTATQPTVNNDPVPQVAEEKKGWSNAAKGAVIGGGAGAIGGAILSKKKGKGAVIGGVLGAAGGYIIGRNKDKKDTTR